MDSDAYSVHSTLSISWPFDRTFLSLLSYYLLSSFLGAVHLLTAAVVGAALLLPMPHSRYNPVTAVIIGSIGGSIAAPLALYVLGPQLGILVSSRVRRSVVRRWAAVVGPGLCLALFGAPVGHTLAAWSGYIPLDCDSSARRYWKTQDGCMSGVHSVIAALLGAAVLGLLMGVIVELGCRFGKEGLWEAVEEGWEGAAGVEWRRRIAERRRMEQGDPRTTSERQPLLNGRARARRRGDYDEERDIDDVSDTSSPPPPRPALLRADSVDGGERPPEMLNLKRPLVSLDLETTGLSTSTSRIVEVGLIKLLPSTNGTARTVRFHSLVRPDVPVPRQASAVHGHTDESLALAPSFASIAPQILSFLAGCDLTGYNILKYDVPLLAAEFARLSPPVPFPSPDALLLDTMAIFHSLVPKRDLAAAYRVYVGDEMQGHHGAEADAEASLRILLAMISLHGSPSPPPRPVPAPVIASQAGPRKGILLNSGSPESLRKQVNRDRSWSGSCDMSISDGAPSRSRASSRASDFSASQDLPSRGLGMPRTVEGILAWAESRRLATPSTATAQAVSAATRSRAASSATSPPTFSPDQRPSALPNLRPDAPAFTTPPKFKRPAPSPNGESRPSQSASAVPTSSAAAGPSATGGGVGIGRRNAPVPLALARQARPDAADAHRGLASSASSSSTIVPIARSRSAAEATPGQRQR